MRYLPDGAPDPASHVQHVALWLSRLTSKYQGKAKIAGTLTALLTAVQGAEDVLWSFSTTRFFPGAKGVQLDTWGQVVGEPRAELVYDPSDPDDVADAVYTLRIQIRVLVNSSDGTLPELLAIATRASGTGNITVFSLPPARVAFFVNVPLATAPGTSTALATADILDGWFLDAAAAGVAVTLGYVPRVSSPQPAGLRWDSAVHPGSYQPGWDSLVTPGTGNLWYGVR